MNHPTILLVDDSDSVRSTVTEILERDGFQVTAEANVKNALNRIATETFDVLLTDLHMPGLADGFTVVSAMRHANPRTVTLLYTGFPDLDEALHAILQQADEILVKPLELATLAGVIRARLKKGTHVAAKIPKTTASILANEAVEITKDWLARVGTTEKLTRIPLGPEERMAHLPNLLSEVVLRLQQPRILEGTAFVSQAAILHGKMRRQQGYTVPMLVAESRILQVSVFHALHRNLNTVNFSLVLADVMTIADELDSQLEQTTQSFLGQLIGQAA